MKVDVAVQNFKKPELLLYTLATLHAQCRDLIDTVYINDDLSGEEFLTVLRSDRVKELLFPWNIAIRVNTQRNGWWSNIVSGYRPQYLTPFHYVKRYLLSLWRSGHGTSQREDIRYQWALDSTDKKYLFVIHDDVEFHDNILALYILTIESLKKPAIVGDLGQCWRCTYQQDGCSSDIIMSGKRPSPIWPDTQRNPGDTQWACRVNEWCSLVSVEATHEILESQKLFFGNMDNNGDSTAYWFYCAVNAGYEFSEPIPTAKRTSYYIHGWTGKSGHHAWTGQSQDERMSDREEAKARLKEMFEFEWES